jgi:hypothetical protein
MILQTATLPEQIEIHLIQCTDPSHPFGVRYFDVESGNSIEGIRFFRTLEEAQKKFDDEVSVCQIIKRYFKAKQEIKYLRN